jgi:hypothetical protein
VLAVLGEDPTAPLQDVRLRLSALPAVDPFPDLAALIEVLAARIAALHAAASGRD